MNFADGWSVIISVESFDGGIHENHFLPPLDLPNSDTFSFTLSFEVTRATEIHLAKGALTMQRTTRHLLVDVESDVGEKRSIPQFFGWNLKVRAISATT